MICIIHIIQHVGHSYNRFGPSVNITAVRKPYNMQNRVTYILYQPISSFMYIEQYPSRQYITEKKL